MRINSRVTVPEVLPLAVAYYADHPIGGNLHVVLDDDNFADKHVIFCAEQAAERDDKAGLRLARMLLRMSKTQRRRLRTLLHISLAGGLTPSTFVS